MSARRAQLDRREAQPSTHGAVDGVIHGPWPDVDVDARIRTCAIGNDCLPIDPTLRAALERSSDPLGVLFPEEAARPWFERHAFAPPRLTVVSWVNDMLRELYEDTGNGYFAIVARSLATGLDPEQGKWIEEYDNAARRCLGRAGNWADVFCEAYGVPVTSGRGSPVTRATTALRDRILGLALAERLRHESLQKRAAQDVADQFGVNRRLVEDAFRKLKSELKINRIG